MSERLTALIAKAVVLGKPHPELTRASWLVTQGIERDGKNAGRSHSLQQRLFCQLRDLFVLACFFGPPLHDLHFVVMQEYVWVLFDVRAAGQWLQVVQEQRRRLIDANRHAL